MDIFYVTAESGYYDGCHEVLTRDPTRKGQYDIIGGEIRAADTKVVIRTLSIDSLFLDQPDAVVTYDSEYARRHWESTVERWRAETKAVLAEFKKPLAKSPDFPPGDPEE